ncbi:unnamed protein product, partial [Mesorhabditis spiculigera]
MVHYRSADPNPLLLRDDFRVERAVLEDNELRRLMCITRRLVKCRLRIIRKREKGDSRDPGLVPSSSSSGMQKAEIIAQDLSVRMLVETNRGTDFPIGIPTTARSDRTEATCGRANLCTNESASQSPPSKVPLSLWYALDILGRSTSAGKRTEIRLVKPARRSCHITTYTKRNPELGTDSAIIVSGSDVPPNG